MNSTDVISIIFAIAIVCAMAYYIPLFFAGFVIGAFLAQCKEKLTKWLENVDNESNESKLDDNNDNEIIDAEVVKPTEDKEDSKSN